MATWTEFTYDDPIRSYRRAMQWVPAGSLKPAIIYCAGHGWNGRDPSAFYDPTVGDTFFLNEIEPKEGTNPVACFAIWTASSAYDFTASSVGWVTSTSYTEGDRLRASDSNVYRCTETHTSGASTEPGVGADWATRWYLCHANELGDNMTIGARHRTPAYLESNQLDLAAVFSYVVAHAEELGVDPSLIFVMGSSAGGQQAGTFAYDLGDAYSLVDRPVLGARYAPLARPKPAGTILRIAPDNWEWFPWGQLMQHLFGRVFTTDEWNEYPTRRKASLSPLGVLRSTADSIPTFLAYGGNGYYNPATDEPPYSTVEYHHARNGYQLFQHLVGTLAQSDVVFTEDHPTTGATLNLWENSGGVLTPSRTIADAEEDSEIWTWFQALTGV